MSVHRTSRRHASRSTDGSRRRRGLVVPLAVIALATTGLASLTSGAFFTDSQAVTGNSFTTGTVKLSATPTSSSVSLTNMAPGDTKVGTVTVKNDGSLAQRYAMVSAATNADGKGLAAALTMTVKTGVTTCTEAGFAGSGASVYSGALGTTSGAKVIGDSAPGPQAGDRSLSAGASEVLCVQVSLPTSADNALQNATTSATFTFNAEQTANNG